MQRRAYLVLDSGHYFEGYAFGAVREVEGEVAINASMAGYLEALTDSGARGKIVVQSFPLIGNYGVNGEDLLGSRAEISGYVVKEWCDTPSNFRSEGNIDDFLKAQNVSGICGVDTRALVKLISEGGATWGKIVYSLDGLALESVKGKLGTRQERG